MIQDIFSNLIFSILKNYIKFILIYYFYLKECKLKNLFAKNLVANLHDKTEYVKHIRNLKQAKF